MKDAEAEFLEAIGMNKEQYDKIPNFRVKTAKGDKIKLILRSKLEPVHTYGDLAMVTISMEDFVYMAEHFQHIVDIITKRQKSTNNSHHQAD